MLCVKLRDINLPVFIESQKLDERLAPLTQGRWHYWNHIHDGASDSS
jgi:hypothetical protein